MGRNGSSDRAGLERHGPRTRVASPPSAATPRSCTFPRGKYEERGGAVRAAAAAVRLEDYDGPLKKIVGTFARKLERKSVHQPHYKPGAMLCSLEPKDKLVLSVQDTLDPVTFLASGFNAGDWPGGKPGPHLRAGCRGVWQALWRQ